VVKTEPDWNRLPESTPSAIRVLLRRCLRKDKHQRFQDATDVRIEVEDALTGGAPAETIPAGRGRHLFGWIATTGAAVLLFGLAAVSFVHFRETPPEVHSARFFVFRPAKATLDANPQVVAISPDGTQLAFQAQPAGGTNKQLWIRPLDSLSARPIPGTEGASQQFWSWDSRYLAFYADGKLKKIAVMGGPAQVLCDAGASLNAGSQGSWNKQGVILFGFGSVFVNTGSPIYRVSAAGGAPAAVTTVDTAQGETDHRWPHFLPDGNHFLYLALNQDQAKSAIRVGSLDSKESKLLLNVQSFAQYAPPGYLLYQRDGTLMAQPFDAAALQFKGEAFPVAEQVQVNPSQGRVAFDVSGNGVLVYRSSGGVLNTQLAWFDRGGKELSRIGEPGGYVSPKLSPDEKQVAVYRAMEIGISGDIWVLNLVRNTQTRLTFDPADDANPLWSPDGSHIAFTSTRNNSFGVYQKNSNGIGEDELLLKVGSPVVPEDWSLDGRFLIYMTTETFGRRLSFLPLTGERKPVPFLLKDQFARRHAQLSPDGHWMAYVSNESGPYQVYVQSFPAGGGKWQVSTTGGVQPRWRHDGKELCAYPVDSTGPKG
jgi:Tol biopolymer transport system component